MRVLYFSRDYTPHDYRFLNSLSEAGYQVYFMQLESKNQALEERTLQKGVERVEWAGGKGEYQLTDLLKYVSSFKDVVQEINPDVVHAGPIQTAGLIAALSGFHPVVTMSWAYDLLFDAEKNLFNKWATKFVLNKSNYLVVDCDTIANIAVDYGFDGEIAKFPWGVDLKKFSPGRNNKLRKKLGWQDEIVLLHLRSWEPIYGVDVLIDGFIHVLEKEPKLRLLLLGGGSQEEIIKAQLIQAGVIDKVNFAGQVANDELPDYYKVADLYISASHSDGSSVSLLEALASGLPAIVSDIPGNIEWVSEGEQGWLFEDGSSVSLSEKILNATENLDCFENVGIKARETAVERADWNKNFKQLTNLYEQAVQETK